MSSRGSSSFWSILFVLIIVGGALLWGLWPEGKSFQEATGLEHLYEWKKFKGAVDEIKGNAEGVLSEREEESMIDQWIIEEGLNEYGDQYGTMYTGGTPLFNEQTGATVDRYDYIKMRHPDSPWDTP